MLIDKGERDLPFCVTGSAMWGDRGNKSWNSVTISRITPPYDLDTAPHLSVEEAGLRSLGQPPLSFWPLAMANWNAKPLQEGLATLTYKTGTVSASVTY